MIGITWILGMSGMSGMRAKPPAWPAAAASSRAVIPRAVIPRAVIPKAVIPKAVIPKAVIPKAVISRAVIPRGRDIDGRDEQYRMAGPAVFPGDSEDHGDSGDRGGDPDQDRVEIIVHVLKDKRGGLSRPHREVCRGPDGLR